MILQDESSNDKHQIAHERYISDTCGGQYTRHSEASYRHVNRIYSQTRIAADARERRSGSLSITRRLQLESMVITIYEHSAWMTEALHHAAKSVCIDPAFIKRLAVVKANLDRDACAINTYIEQNKERGTGQLKQRVTLELSEARNLFRYMHKILTMERALL